MLKARLAACVPIVEAQIARKEPRLITVPGRELQQRLNRELVVRSWLWGYLTARQELGEMLRRRELRFMGSDPPELDWSGPPPKHAMEWAFSRYVLLGKWDRQLDDSVSAILVHALEVGATRKELSRMLAEVFPDFSKARLENIARTETTAALTQGRLAQFRENSRVAAVQFVAIMDARTTVICRSRDGLIMMLDDPALTANTPPLHFHCRSTLVPVSYWDLEDLEAGDPEALERFFGYLPEGAPKSLDEAMGGWKRAEDPLPGFGGAGARKARKPEIRVAQPDDGSGTGYGSHLPPARATTHTDVPVGSSKIRVKSHWIGTGELESVRKAIEVFREETLQGIQSINFINSAIPVPEGQIANGRYVRFGDAIYIELTRAGRRDWRSSASSEDQLLAFLTTVHELAHHIYYQSWYGDKALLREWGRALIDDSPELVGDARVEGFPNQFTKFIEDPDEFSRTHPNIARVFRGLIR